MDRVINLIQGIEPWLSEVSKILPSRLVQRISAAFSEYVINMDLDECQNRLLSVIGDYFFRKKLLTIVEDQRWKRKVENFSNQIRIFDQNLAEAIENLSQELSEKICCWKMFGKLKRASILYAYLEEKGEIKNNKVRAYVYEVFLREKKKQLNQVTKQRHEKMDSTQIYPKRKIPKRQKDVVPVLKTSTLNPKNRPKTFRFKHEMRRQYIQTKIQKQLSSENYSIFMKIFHLFMIGIMHAQEFIESAQRIPNIDDFMINDIINQIQSKRRRKYSYVPIVEYFDPNQERNSQGLQFVTPSYVPLPKSYSTAENNKSYCTLLDGESCRQILNYKYIQCTTDSCENFNLDRKEIHHQLQNYVEYHLMKRNALKLVIKSLDLIPFLIQRNDFNPTMARRKVNQMKIQFNSIKKADEHIQKTKNSLSKFYIFDEKSKPIPKQIKNQIEAIHQRMIIEIEDKTQSKFGDFRQLEMEAKEIKTKIGPLIEQPKAILDFHFDFFRKDPAMYYKFIDYKNVKSTKKIKRFLKQFTKNKIEAFSKLLNEISDTKDSPEHLSEEKAENEDISKSSVAVQFVQILREMKIECEDALSEKTMEVFHVSDKKPPFLIFDFDKKEILLAVLESLSLHLFNSREKKYALMPIASIIQKIQSFFSFSVKDTRILYEKLATKIRLHNIEDSCNISKMKQYFDDHEFGVFYSFEKGRNERQRLKSRQTKFHPLQQEDEHVLYFQYDEDKETFHGFLVLIKILYQLGELAVQKGVAKQDELKYLLLGIAAVQLLKSNSKEEQRFGIEARLFKGIYSLNAENSHILDLYGGFISVVNLNEILEKDKSKILVNSLSLMNICDEFDHHHKIEQIYAQDLTEKYPLECSAENPIVLRAIFKREKMKLYVNLVHERRFKNAHRDEEKMVIEMEMQDEHMVRN